jgi:Na+-driven multidrug efflux pump
MVVLVCNYASPDPLVVALLPQLATFSAKYLLSSIAFVSMQYRETVCFIVGSFGVVPLCVHTIAYQLVPLLFMVPLGIMIGLTVRLGHLMAFDVQRAKKLATWCMFFTTVLGGIVSSLLFQFRVEIAMLFTTDEEVVQGCKEIWSKLCYYIFVLYIFGINSAILRALGMQWQMAAIIFASIWLLALPALVIFAVRREGGIDVVWNILPIFYTCMQFLLVHSYTTVDWNKISNEIRANASDEETRGNYVLTEETKLLPATKKTKGAHKMDPSCCRK